MYAKTGTPESIDLKEAAAFLGFKGTYHLREKAATGQIPGAFKVSNRWMFLKDDLVEYVRGFQKRLHDASVVIPKRSDRWRLAKRQAALTTTPASRSAESECKNLLDVLAKETRNSMKKNVEKT